MSRTMRVAKCPSDTLSMTNRVVVNTEDWDPATTPHLQAGATTNIISKLDVWRLGSFTES